MYEINHRMGPGNHIRTASTPAAARRMDDGPSLDGWVWRHDGRRLQLHAPIWLGRDALRMAGPGWCYCLVGDRRGGFGEQLEPIWERITASNCIGADLSQLWQAGSERLEYLSVLRPKAILRRDTMCGGHRCHVLVPLRETLRQTADRPPNPVVATQPINCQNCGSIVSPEFAWCPKCGAALRDHPCAYCGQMISPGNKTCNFCGAPIGPV